MSKLFPLNNFNFTSQYGTGTLASERPPTVQAKPKAKPDAANIIGASAEGLDSITGLIGTLMGSPSPAQTQTYNPPPPPKKKVSPLLIGGIIGGVALIILLIVLNNGKSSPSPSK